MTPKQSSRPANPDEERIAGIKKRYKFAEDYWQKQFENMAEDIKHLNPDTQFPDGTREARRGKPTVAVDRLNTAIHSIVNSQRQSRPAILVNATDNPDVQVAEVIQGLIRHIETSSKANLAYDEGMLQMTQAGIGWWRIVTEQADDSFDQDIKILPIINQFSVLPDPMFTMPDMSDIDWAFIGTTISRDDYKEEYPDSLLASYSPFEFQNDYNEWIDNTDMTCRIAEYFYKEKEPYELVLLENGKTMDRADWTKARGKITRTRKSTRNVVKWLKLNGIEILEESTFPGGLIPLVACLGNPLLVDKKRMYSGLVRNSYEAQMSLNAVRSATMEAIATFNKVPIIGPTGFAASHQDDWAHPYDKAYLEYDPISNEDGSPLPPPSRDMPEPPIQAMMQFGQSLEEDLRAINAMYSPDTKHQVANDISGEAIKQMVQQGDTSNFQYTDNLARAIELTGRILLGLIPLVYAEKRVVRIIGLDDTHKLITINSKPGEPVATPDNIDEDEESGIPRIYDLTTGKYDVSISAGPSYQSQREASRNLLWTLAGKDPALMQSAGDLIVAMNDDPAMKPLAERLNKIIVTANPALAEQKGKKQDPAQLAQQLEQAHQMIQQLTQSLTQETQELKEEKTGSAMKLQIEQLKQQTNLLKQQMEIAHDSAKLDYAAALKDLSDKSDKEHDLIKGIHQHLLDKELATHQTALNMAETAAQPPPGSMQPSGAGVETPPIGPSNPTAPQ